MTRQANVAIQTRNGAVICDRTFVAGQTVPQDSCDEYPFAASRQSGAAYVVRGSECAEVTPVVGTDAPWEYNLNRYSGAERCLRAHVPLQENLAVGTALSILTQTERILDNDPHVVEVTD